MAAKKSDELLADITRSFDRAEEKLKRIERHFDLTGTWLWLGVIGIIGLFGLTIALVLGR